MNKGVFTLFWCWLEGGLPGVLQCQQLLGFANSFKNVKPTFCCLILKRKPFPSSLYSY